jgi:hypothetical protein
VPVHVSALVPSVVFDNTNMVTVTPGRAPTGQLVLMAGY